MTGFPPQIKSVILSHIDYFNAPIGQRMLVAWRYDYPRVPNNRGRISNIGNYTRYNTGDGLTNNMRKGFTTRRRSGNVQR
jgi:hypothetical protein